MFRLRPSKRTNEILLYCLALAARKTGVEIHSVVVMSNHHHMVVTDVMGVVPDFLQEFHLAVSKVLNASQGQWGSLWDGKRAHRAPLVEDEDVLREMAYSIANPVAAGLVERPSEWPGVLLWGERRVVVRRPDDYFDPSGNMPEELELVITKPRVRMAGWERRLEAEVAALVTKAHRAMKASGRKFLGKARVLATSILAMATSTEEKRGLVPRVAAIRQEVRIEVLRWYRRFQGAYRVALEAWRGGNREAVFPAGTWWMRVHHGARVSASIDPI